MKLYLSGPMAGISEANHPAFARACTALRLAGHEVLSPHETDGGSTDKPRSFYMRQDVAAVLQVDAVVVLAGWENSKGSQLEVAIAREIDIPVFSLGEALEVKP